MRKDNKKKREEVEIQQPRFTRVQVSIPVQHQNLKSTLDFEWPEFCKEADRIKAYKQRYANVPLDEAMFGRKIDTTVEIPETPITPTVGQLLQVTMQAGAYGWSVTGVSTKETIVCKNNLSRYKNANFRNRQMTAKVINVDKQRQTIYVDVLQPLFEGWVNRILEDKTIQYDVKAPQVIQVSDLKLSNGGFLGKALVPELSEVLGEPYYVDAFIPGSQIVLNIEDNFEQWNGKTVEAFVTNYMLRPGSVNQMSLICSRKAVLNFAGNLQKIELYKDYCDNGKKWNSFTKSVQSGIVTGVINSAKKCGVFVELPVFNITGMVAVDPEKLVDYKKGQEVAVRITDFEQMLTYDQTTGTTVHQIPYEIVENKLKSCILKPVLEFA